MSRQVVIQESDTLLGPFLKADNETDLESVLTELISIQATPIIKGIIRYKLRAQINPQSVSRQSLDAEDIRSEVVLQLLKRLQALRDDPNNTIENFRSYVATTTYHTCDQFLRREHPQRWHLKNKLRYILKHRPIFALWRNGDEGWSCGLTAWRDQLQIMSSSLAEFPKAGRSQQLLDRLKASGAKEFTGKNPRQLKIEDLLLAIFKQVGMPIKLDELVTVVSNLCDISEQTPQPPGRPTHGNKTNEFTAEAHKDVAFEVEMRNNLERTWAEICQLPTRQRAALLLNLRDSRGRSALLLIPVTGIATVHQIAEALDIPAEQFAVLWNLLPLDDATIADHLGVTRQQVINLRKSARERLARRLKSLRQT
jgi:DNA-directed RNA polymerase specialized sigma24 family protein